MLDFLKKVWEWLKKSWQWLALGFAVLFAFLFFRRKNPVVVVQPDAHRKEVEKEVEKKQEEARIERDEKVVEAKLEQTTDLAALKEKQEDRVEEFDTPEEINSFLKQVGKDIRE